MNTIRKLITSSILIALIWALQLIDFIALEVQKTVLYPIAECIVDNYMVVFFLLLIMSIAGIVFKNRWAYYRVFVNIEVVLCYVSVFSMVATQNFPFGTQYLLVRLIIFSVSFILTYIFIDELKEETKLEKQNELNPIIRHEDLYEDRRYQLNNLINIISNEESDYGYSICISAKWGSGKTSFVNCVLNKLTSEYDNNKSMLSIAEIRINAMELDNLSSLVNYLFDRIKDILKESGIYVGISSEYQDLISSLMGTVTTEATGDFIKSKLSSNSDYRENLSNLNQLIITQLKNKKIIIIVDDLERCTKEKSLEFLLFIKEIAMLNRCVIIFLTDYDKLKKQTELEDDFLEKFFNYKMNLHSVSSQEILQKSIIDENFLELINVSQTMFANKIEKAKKELYLYIENTEQRRLYKEKRLSQELENYELFVEKTQNPRQLIKTYKKYKELLKLVEVPSNMSERIYCDFINKVDYKKQIFIISMIYGFDLKHYEIIEHTGIGSYLSTLNQLYIKSENEQNSEDNVIDILAYEEWVSYSNTYITNEKLRFVSWLLSYPNELTKIATGFTSLQEEYISLIQNNLKPNGISLLDILKETINANFSSDLDKKRYLLQTINLYKNEMNIDDAISILYDSKIRHYIERDDCIIEIFYSAFKDGKIINQQQCLDKFISFAEHYTYFKLNNITRYVSLLDDSDSEYHYINEVVYNNPSCSSMIYAYFNKITNDFKLHLGKHTSAISCLKALCGKTNSYCNRNNISSLADINILSDRANKTIGCIDYLLKLEQCLNVNEDIQFRNSIIGDNYSEKLEDVIELINNSNEDEMRKLWQPINSLLSEMVNTNVTITREDLVKINIVILSYCNKFNEPIVPWRKMYIQIKNKFQNNNIL